MTARYPTAPSCPAGSAATTCASCRCTESTWTVEDRRRPATANPHAHRHCSVTSEFGVRSELDAAQDRADRDDARAGGGPSGGVGRELELERAGHPAGPPPAAAADPA